MWSRVLVMILVGLLDCVRIWGFTWSLHLWNWYGFMGNCLGLFIIETYYYSCLLLVWLNEHALFVGMFLFNVHKGFMCINVLFLSIFSNVSAYGLILSTSGVLTPFLPFPYYFRFGHWSDFEDNLKKALISWSSK